MSKKEVQRQKDEYVDYLGREHRIFLEYDRDALMRLAIADWNFKNPTHVFDDEIISEILARINVEDAPDGTECLFSINNPVSRRKGLSRLLGPKLFSLVKRDATILGRMIAFSKDIRQDHVTMEA